MKKDCCLKFFLKNGFILMVTLNILLIILHSMNFWACERPKIFRWSREAPITKGMYELPEFKYLISKSKCFGNSSGPDPDPYYVTLVHSSPTHFERRAACRDTWANSNTRIKTYFLLGMVKLPSLQRRIDEEDSQHNDIIQGNFIDSYHNLTYKHTMALKWFSETCPQVKFLLKMDDDVFVNVPAVHNYLANNKNKNKFIFGPYREPTKVNRTGKWGISREEYIDAAYPEFVEGSTVIYSNDFVREAFKRTFTTKFLWIDDVYITGIVRMQMNVRIESIYPYLLAGEALKSVLNGTTTDPPDSEFLFSEQYLKAKDMFKLWKYVKSFRKMHQIESEDD